MPSNPPIEKLEVDENLLDTVIKETNLAVTNGDVKVDPFVKLFEEGQRLGSQLAVNQGEVEDCMRVCTQRSNIHRHRASASLGVFTAGACTDIISSSKLYGFGRQKFVQLVGLAYAEADQDLPYSGTSPDGIPLEMPDWVYNTQTSKWITEFARQLQGKQNVNSMIVEIINSGLVPKEAVEQILGKSPALRRKLKKRNN